MNRLRNASSALLLFILVLSVYLHVVGINPYFATVPAPFKAVLSSDSSAKLMVNTSHVDTISEVHGGHSLSNFTRRGNHLQDHKDNFENNISHIRHQMEPKISINKMQVLEYTEPREQNHLVILSYRDSRCKTPNLDRACVLPGGKTCSHVCAPSYYNQSEAVIFNWLYVDQYPFHRFRDQKWVVVDREAPPQSQKGRPKKETFQRIKGQFNITSFFTSDSTVPYTNLRRCGINSTTLSHLRASGVNYGQSKTGNAVWFVSNCKTQSQREQYVKELQKFIDVDIYGKCGNDTCGQKRVHMPPCAVDMLNTKYRFYIAFENSFCQEYLTEKLEKILRYDINTIPVVMGSADYSALLPEKTFIDVKNYQNPKHLAHYLHQVAQNHTLFNEYVQRKKSLTCGGVRHEDFYLCRLCSHLHAKRGQVETIPGDVTSFWSFERRCTNPQTHIPGEFWQTPE